MRIRARSRVTHVIDDCIISHSVILAASTKLMKWPVVNVYNSVLSLQQAQVQKWGMGNLGTYYLTASDRALEYSYARLGQYAVFPRESLEIWLQTARAVKVTGTWQKERGSRPARTDVFRPLLRRPRASSAQHDSQNSRTPARRSLASIARPIPPCSRPWAPRSRHARRGVSVAGFRPPPAQKTVRDYERVPCAARSATMCLSERRRRPCYSVRRRSTRPRLPARSERFGESLLEAHFGAAGDASFEAEGGGAARERWDARCPR